ncbi:hypothetical protein F5984_07225 [Rudanella paleaurantiibacter]|uniref:Surface-adhesin protein E-like domain-containing protein n=1 Tax=Rudanella paleaurantiibacter TaxID=2614655 RepID=A0A7J5U2T9_9BACT|nr:surface-adhesin E family protein [Rudanella paleaurantiibacter]KAB7732001.1 hypothetical protein F5984_07225 [Rudanella paleaurantiibacter]
MKSLFIILFTFLVTHSSAQDWIYVSTGVNHDKFYIKLGGVTENGYLKVWTKTLKKSLKYTKRGKNYSIPNGFVIDLNECDCKNRRSRFLSGVYYSSKNIVVHSEDVDEYDLKWFYVSPDSIGEKILDIVCQNDSEFNSR